MAFYYLILPHSKIGQLLRSPFMKFMYHSAAFGVFLILLIMASVNLSDDKTQQARREQRGPQPTTLEWLVVFYVTGEWVNYLLSSCGATYILVVG